MPDKRGDILRLADLLSAMRKIRDFTDGGHDAFLSSEVIQDAVIRNLEIIGEVAGKMSPELRNAHPEVPWAKMRGFASLAKHEYWRLDLDQVWGAIESIPLLESAASRIRADRTTARGDRK